MFNHFSVPLREKCDFPSIADLEMMLCLPREPPGMGCLMARHGFCDCAQNDEIAGQARNDAAERPQ